ncbi:lysine histidine transporter-like 8 [Rutidosis leptorrhynchoides]|uniref:lysine histidine transporter-like 8 n=1 Tax=Rutidosis leptorrhynchoides TaxID=125765 RepID=UPI003A98EEE0
MVENEPATYREAVSSSEGPQWKEAVKSEIDFILQNHTLELVDLPPGCKPLGYRWIFKKKLKPDGTIDKYKASNEKMIKSTKDMLKSKFDMNDMGLADVILGVKITRTKSGLILSQTHYVDKIPEKFNANDSNIARTPIDPSQHLVKNRGEPVNQLEYSRIIGSLIYTREYELHYNRYPVVIEGHCDANWISGINDSRATSGYILTLGGSAISWKSSKQTSPSPANSIPMTPKSPFITRVMTPLASPMKKAISNLQGYLEFTKLNPQDEWLPITESRNGNAFYAAFHTLSSGIGVQALVLPLAFTVLGWVWGIMSLSICFVWQMYTLWLLIQLHESPFGTRYSRYLWLSMATFGEKLGKLMTLLPTIYLSSGTCITLIMIGGSTLKLLYNTIVDNTWDENNSSLSMIEWYLVFTCLAVVLAQLPNLNSIAGVSLIGSIASVSYCTIIWTVSVVEGRPSSISYEETKEISQVARVCDVLNALGIVAFAFRGHNLVLEIQGTMPSTQKKPSRVPMWKGVKYSYFIIAMCLFPLAIGGYSAYGNLMPTTGGMLTALYKYHGQSTSKAILGSTSTLVIINSLTSFQIYAMPVFDNLELRYITKTNGPCPWWVRAGSRVFFGALAFFVAVALPFLPSLAGLIGGIALPVTLAYPCFMWIVMKKPEKYSKMWWLNWILGCLGMTLSILLVFGAVWTIVTRGIEVHFFKPK